MEIGKAKAIWDRQRQYGSSVSQLMIVYLFFDRVGFQWWYLLVVPIWLLFIWVDLKYIMPGEYNYVWNKNPMVKKLMEGR